MTANSVTRPRVVRKLAKKPMHPIINISSGRRNVRSFRLLSISLRISRYDASCTSIPTERFCGSFFIFGSTMYGFEKKSSFFLDSVCSGMRLSHTSNEQESIKNASDRTLSSLLMLNGTYITLFDPLPTLPATLSRNDSPVSERTLKYSRPSSPICMPCISRGIKHTRSCVLRTLSSYPSAYSMA